MWGATRRGTACGRRELRGMASGFQSCVGFVSTSGGHLVDAVSCQLPVAQPVIRVQPGLFGFGEVAPFAPDARGVLDLVVSEGDGEDVPVQRGACHGDERLT